METDQELLDRANKERAEIVARYDKGRDAKIDPWEEVDETVYTCKDRYGFIHDAPLPIMKDAEKSKMLQVERERQKKWLKMTNNWAKYSDGPKMESRIFKGIPNVLRGKAWMKLLEIERLKREQHGVYGEMRQRARNFSPDIRQIDLDVNRTYRDHEMFRARYDHRQQDLFHVLAAYSMYNTEVGYCQGMSQIAALLLMYLNEEEDAFWGLFALLNEEKYGMHGFFIPGFPKLLRFQDHHDNILKKFLPKVKKHLAKNDIFASLYTIKWFLQCFLDRVPFPLVLRLWDIWMLKGQKILTAMSYNLLKMHKRRLLKMNMEELIGFVQGMLVKDFGYPDDKVIESLQVCMEELRKAGMELPPKPANPDLEVPQKPFGLFVPPSVEQIIGRRTMDTEQELIRGKRRSSSILRPVVPADGGEARLPSPPIGEHLARTLEEERASHRGASSRSSPAADSSIYDTASQPDGFSSRASITDYHSSRTSYVGSEYVNDYGAVASGGRTVVRVGGGGSRERSEENDAILPAVSSKTSTDTAEQIRQVSRQLQHISRVQVTDSDSEIPPTNTETEGTQHAPQRDSRTSQLSHSPSLQSQYDNVNNDNVNSNVNTMYEQNLESTLNDMELAGTGQVTVNGHRGESYGKSGASTHHRPSQQHQQQQQQQQQQHIVDHRSYSQGSSSQSRDYRSHTEQIVQLNGPSSSSNTTTPQRNGTYQQQQQPQQRRQQQRSPTKISPTKSPRRSPTKSPPPASSSSTSSPPKAVVIPIQRIQSPTSPTAGQTVIIPIQREPQPQRTRRSPQSPPSNSSSSSIGMLMSHNSRHHSPATSPSGPPPLQTAYL